MTPRMTRSAAIKHELDDTHSTVRPATRNSRQPTAELPERGSSKRPMSICSITSSTSELQPSAHASSNAAVANSDVAMTGMSDAATDGLDRARASPAADTLSGDGENGSARNTEHVPSDAQEDSEDDFESLGQDSLPLFELSQHLEGLGIANTLPSLPKATLVGDQNHGKSSVGEAISGISFPREEGTCTRAPFEVTVSPAEPGVEWEASIKLFIKYEYTPKSKARDSYSYAGWTECHPVTIPFRTTRNKEEAAQLLQDAQLAILNPPYQNLLNGNHPRPSNNGVMFTPNVIQVHVKRKAKLSLSFIDLPGLVHRLPPAQQHLVDLVRKLVRNYVQEPNSLILLTHSSDIDIETTQAYNLVVQAKAQDRTIGILTKPDNARNNGRARMAIVHRFLRGDFPLGAKDGWFVTKQLSSDDLESGITHAQAREMEQNFFSQAPWAHEWAEFSSRFGTPNLARAISMRLRDHILRQLPEMVNKVNDRLQSVNAQLETFPKPSHSPTSTVLEAIRKVDAIITANVSGTGLDKTFSKDFKQAMIKMRSVLESVRPRPVLRTPGYEPPAISIDLDDDDDADLPTPSKKGKSNAGQPFSTPQGRRVAQSETPRRSVKPEHIQRAETPGSGPRAEFRLDQIRDLIEGDGSRSLAVTVDPKVLDQLISYAQQDWRNIVRQTLNAIAHILSATLGTSVEKALVDRLATPLCQRTLTIVTHFVDGLLAEEESAVMRIVGNEMHARITHYLNIRNDTARIEAKLDEKRLIERLDEHFDTLAAQNSNTPSSKVPMSREARLKQKDDFAQKYPDEYAREVKAIAYPIAYYNHATNRMVDTIALELERGLLSPIETKMFRKLQEGLDASNEAACIELLLEDPGRERERLQLMREKEHLEEAVQTLMNLPQMHAMQQ